MDFDETLIRAQGEILESVICKDVPPDVKSFSELHDYVDANGYGGAFEVEHLDIDFWDRIQTALDWWIQAGGIRSGLQCWMRCRNCGEEWFGLPGVPPAADKLTPEMVVGMDEDGVPLIECCGEGRLG